MTATLEIKENATQNQSKRVLQTTSLTVWLRPVLTLILCDFNPCNCTFLERKWVRKCTSGIYFQGSLIYKIGIGVGHWFSHTGVSGKLRNWKKNIGSSGDSPYLGLTFWRQWVRMWFLFLSSMRAGQFQFHRNNLYWNSNFKKEESLEIANLLLKFKDNWPFGWQIESKNTGSLSESHWLKNGYIG